MGLKIGQIFNERPEQWGLRGDPFLWDEMEKFFSNYDIPFSEEDFKKEINLIFRKLTGDTMDSKENIHVQEFSHGGMSSGMISTEFWLNRALPMLIQRLRKLNQGI